MLIGVLLAANLVVFAIIIRMLLSIERRLRRDSRLDYERHLMMSKELDDLTAEVTETSGFIDSAVTLIEGIAARIEAAGIDRQKLTALTTELNAKSDALAAAVAANTPAAEEPQADSNDTNQP